MKRFSIYLMALMLFYGCAIKPIPNLEPVINLETKGMLIFTQGEFFFLPDDPDSLFPPEFAEHKLRGIIVASGRKIDGSYMQEIGAVEYGYRFPPNTPIRCKTGYYDDNYFIKHDSCYICYGSIKLIGYEKLRIILARYSNGDISTYDFTWNVIVDSIPINCNILGGGQLYLKGINAENIDRKQLHDYLSGTCQNKSKTQPKRE